VLTRHHDRRTAATTRLGPLHVEPLELRRLLAADPGGTATIDASTPRLDVEGTRRADAIQVSLNGTTGQIDVAINNAAAGSFNTAQISAGIRIDGRAGNDTITVGPGITLPVEVLGDRGNDTITGGDGAEIIEGGAGNDTCVGNGGNDDMDGGVGNDNVDGGAGDDRLHGGRGRDTLRGVDGNDLIGGGAGNDDCDGGTGNDLVRGDEGRDRVRGGSDDDEIHGGSGSDDAAGDDGNDRVRGEDGRDVCDGGNGDDSVHGGRGRDRVRGGSGNDDFDDATDDRGRDGDRSNEFEDRSDDDGVHIPAGEVPAAVTAAFNTRYPGATVRGIERETEDGGIQYKFDFVSTDGQRVRARFTEAGELVREDVDGQDDGGGGGVGGGNDGEHISPAQLPVAVFTAFNTRYPGATIREVERESEDEGIVYKIDFLRDGRRFRAEFNSVGQFLREEARD